MPTIVHRITLEASWSLCDPRSCVVLFLSLAGHSFRAMLFSLRLAESYRHGGHGNACISRCASETMPTRSSAACLHVCALKLMPTHPSKMQVLVGDQVLRGEAPFRDRVAAAESQMAQFLLVATKASLLRRRRIRPGVVWCRATKANAATGTGSSQRSNSNRGHIRNRSPCAEATVIRENPLPIRKGKGRVRNTGDSPQAFPIPARGLFRKVEAWGQRMHLQAQRLGT